MKNRILRAFILILLVGFLGTLACGMHPAYKQKLREQTEAQQPKKKTVDPDSEWKFRVALLHLLRDYQEYQQQQRFWVVPEPDPLENLQRQLDYIEWMLEQQEMERRTREFRK